ncbi:MAG: N(4)-(beta-N-acetylglucosaminyl)-L-asparaginase [Candidatus Eremiobacteraeota bacterium]|nr:N(4)-(beta-N-acetylglucosaminyl)-L-asparaginase [Candidatus Eremiobacteraeota bacterium]MBV8498081.1 N(4)-(beta-N-acetylglucosaminyl)-L-asparaginase [Candidatus Eremiobacteraeota bacterium]
MTEPLDRRAFLAATGAAAAALATTAGAPAQSDAGAVFLSTWDFGAEANRRAAEVFAAGGSLLDAIEKGVNVVEDDPNVTSVGYGGLPNSEGEVELDAGIMDGTSHRAGSICNLHKIKNPISVARLLMEKTLHTTMAGDGALRFAIEMGFTPQQLLTPKSLTEWLKWKNTPNHSTFWIDREHHDTIGMLGADGKGKVAAGCSTSGLAWKLPGRVADSPLVGCGYYADDAAGAASATGNGDVMANYCTSFFIVNRMAGGAHPQEACNDLMRFMARTAPQLHEDMYCVIAIAANGEIGAASMNSKQPLQYALWKNGSGSIHTAPPFLG